MVLDRNCQCGAPFSTCACVYKVEKDVPSSQILHVDTNVLVQKTFSLPKQTIRHRFVWQ